MIFSSIPFIFFFLPIFLVLYYIVPFKVKNIVLLIFSLIFYAWGEPIYILLMLFSSIFDYVNGILIERVSSKSQKKRILIISIIGNLLILGFFKYSDFLINNINTLLGSSFSLLNIPLPLGISFFTFQTMSYTIDVYREKVKAETNFFDFLTYVSMFPQLIAGPIVRYDVVAKELKERELTFSKFSDGFVRFLTGLFKKVIIANILGELWLEISTNYLTYSSFTCLLGLFAFSFQIFFDFSGYSDMAIGLGKMLGFNYPENFNYPYISTSITDFWRRWHITLSTFFKDYVYIPLGGNKCNQLKNIRNILIVWLLTGLWHGANWNYILWGLYFGVILVVEKFVLKKWLERLPVFLKHVYAICFILFGWLIFAFENFDTLIAFTKNLIGLNGNLINNDFWFYLKSYIVILLVAILFSIPFYDKFKNFVNHSKYKFFWLFLIFIGFILLFIITISLLVSNSYNPFLYFRF